MRKNRHRSTTCTSLAQAMDHHSSKRGLSLKRQALA